LETRQEKNDLRGSLRKKEEERKKAYNEQIEKAKNAGDEAKAKRVANEKAEKVMKVSCSWSWS
jgi:hypothetical protein